VKDRKCIARPSDRNCSVLEVVNYSNMQRHGPNNGTMASMCYCHQTYTAYEFVCTEKSSI